MKHPHAPGHEHDNLRASLAAACAERGALGQAARSLAHRLKPHLDREERLVHSMLALLPGIVEGRPVPDAVAVITATRELKNALPDMLGEHEAIRRGLAKLRSAAVAACRPAYERFADSLLDHFEAEEEVLYPAAILIGEWMALRLQVDRLNCRVTRPTASRPGPLL